MIGIDTNILVRYLTEDDEIQSSKAVNLIEKYAGINGSIFINNIIICQLVWVLERGYKYSKDQVIKALKSVLTTKEFSFEDHQILWISSTQYSDSSADFSDILIGHLNSKNGCNETYTFYQKASMLEMFSIIK